MIINYQYHYHITIIMNIILDIIKTIITIIVIIVIYYLSELREACQQRCLQQRRFGRRVCKSHTSSIPLIYSYLTT